MSVHRGSVPVCFESALTLAKGEGIGNPMSISINAVHLSVRCKFQEQPMRFLTAIFASILSIPFLLPGWARAQGSGQWAPLARKHGR